MSGTEAKLSKLDREILACLSGVQQEIGKITADVCELPQFGEWEKGQLPDDGEQRVKLVRSALSQRGTLARAMLMGCFERIERDRELYSIRTAAVHWAYRVTEEL